MEQNKDFVKTLMSNINSFNLDNFMTIYGHRTVNTERIFYLSPNKIINKYPNIRSMKIQIIKNADHPFSLMEIPGEIRCGKIEMEIKRGLIYPVKTIELFISKEDAKSLCELLDTIVLIKREKDNAKSVAERRYLEDKNKKDAFEALLNTIRR